MSLKSPEPLQFHVDSEEHMPPLFRPWGVGKRGDGVLDTLSKKQGDDEK